MIVVAVTAIALASGIYVASRRNPVTATNVNDAVVDDMAPSLAAA